MSADLVKVLSSCGITNELAQTLAKKYASDHDRIVKDPVAFIQDYWYDNTNMGDLMYFYNKDQMKQALLKLSVKPDVATTIAAAPHNEALFPHRDAIEWASIVIEGQHRKAVKAH